YIGLLFFLVFGRARLPRSRRIKQREINAYILDTTEGIERVRRDPPWPPWLEPVVQLNRTLGSMPLVGGHVARACRVLHPVARRHDAAVLRRARRRARPRRHGAGAARPPRQRGLPG